MILSRGLFFPHNGGTLPRGKCLLQESDDKLKLYVFMHFPWFIKVKPK